MLITLATLCAVAGCGDAPHRGRSTTTTTQPHAADRYARLLREQLTATDPVAIEQQLTCEARRIGQAFGAAESRVRLHVVEDSVLRTLEERALHRRVRTLVAGRSYETDGSLCDSLNATADQELPLIPTTPSFDSATTMEW
jgi:hypothetical protein